MTIDSAISGVGKQAVMLVVVALLQPWTAFAEIYSDDKGINWCYQRKGNVVVIQNVGDIPKYRSAIDPDEAVGPISVPDIIDGRQVVEIGEGAFTNCTQMISVIIPEGVAAIATNAFVGCSSLSNVLFPSTVRSPCPTSWSILTMW